MAKARIWSSGAGIISLLFYLAAIAGTVLQFINWYLPQFQAEYLGGSGDIYVLIAFIVLIAAAFFGLLAIIISMFGIPKVLWIIFALATLICIAVFPIIDIFGTAGSFFYIDMTWYGSHALDFIGFWVGAGGAFLAMVIGFFVPQEL